MLSPAHGILDRLLQERLHDLAGILVDQTGHTLDTAATSETTNGRLSDTLNVVTYVYSNYFFTSKFWLILAKIEGLVLGCIDADFCK